MWYKKSWRVQRRIPRLVNDAVFVMVTTSRAKVTKREMKDAFRNKKA